MLINLGKKIQHGFTIVELLVVIVVIGILAAITIVSYTGISSRATVSSLQSDLTNALTQLKLDQVSNSMFPSSLAAANGGKGIPSTSGTSYTYTYSNTTNPQTFCITATKNNISYNITGDGNSQPGICPVLNLDAGNISSYPGTGTTWTDLSGNGNSGTLNGGVTYSASNGGALSFDGVDDYAIASGGSPMISSGATQISITAWVNILAGGVIASQNGPFFLQVSGGKLASSNEIYTSSGWKSVSGNAVIPTSTWNYLVITYDGTNIKNYINGNLDSTTPQTGALGSMPLTCVGIGRGTSGGCGGTPASYFKGLISTVSVYNITLSDSDIQQNFNNLRGRYGI